eukprot:1138563-Pelagomonas_calceolata.AAC.3
MAAYSLNPPSFVVYPSMPMFTKLERHRCRKHGPGSMGRKSARRHMSKIPRFARIVFHLELECLSVTMRYMDILQQETQGRIPHLSSKYTVSGFASAQSFAWVPRRGRPWWRTADAACSEVRVIQQREHVFWSCPHAQVAVDVLAKNLPSSISLLPMHVWLLIPPCPSINTHIPLWAIAMSLGACNKRKKTCVNARTHALSTRAYNVYNSARLDRDLVKTAQMLQLVQRRRCGVQCVAANGDKNECAWMEA